MLSTPQAREPWLRAPHRSAAGSGMPRPLGTGLSPGPVVSSSPPCSFQARSTECTQARFPRRRTLRSLARQREQSVIYRRKGSLFTFVAEKLRTTQKRAGADVDVLGVSTLGRIPNLQPLPSPLPLLRNTGKGLGCKQKDLGKQEPEKHIFLV